MRFQFLGTSSGTPTKQRNTSALILQPPGMRRWYLVDCGEATQHRLLHSSYSLHRLAAIFITHVHGDHCLGLPGLLSTMSLNNRSRPLPIIAPGEIAHMLRVVLDTTQANLDYPLEFIAVDDLASQAWEQDGVSVHAHPLSHRVPSYAYHFCAAPPAPKLDHDKLAAAGIAPGPLWGQLQRGEQLQLDDGRCLRGEDFLLPPGVAPEVVVAGDNADPDCLSEACRTAQVLIHEATFSSEHRATAQTYGHCDAETIARFAAAQHLSNLVLTHFSPRYADSNAEKPSVQTLAQEARAFYSGNLFMARDLATYYLGANGVLHEESRPTSAD